MKRRKFLCETFCKGNVRYVLSILIINEGRATSRKISAHIDEDEKAKREPQKQEMQRVLRELLEEKKRLKDQEKEKERRKLEEMQEDEKIKKEIEAMKLESRREEEKKKRE